VRSEKTGEYGGTPKHILPALGDRKLRDVSPSDLQQFVSALTVEKRKKVGKQVALSRVPASQQTDSR
jgi:hypothetical protein